MVFIRSLQLAGVVCFTLLDFADNLSEVILNINGFLTGSSNIPCI